jgi:NAD+ kinase
LGVVQRAVLFVNLHKTGSESAAREIQSTLESRGVKTTTVFINGRPGSMPEGKWDIAFTLGGDGTVLYASRLLAASDTPILPLQMGTLGFISGVEMHEWLSVYEKWLKGEARLSPRCMLDISVERKNQDVCTIVYTTVCTKVDTDMYTKVYTNTCLNDAVISSLGIAKLIQLHAKTEVIRGEFAELGYYRSDGLIIATPTGSTAYSMAAGGPILDPEMEAQILNPICPFTLSNRPIVLPSRQPLHITVEKEQRSGVLLTVDGQDTFELEPCDIITVSRSAHYAQLITTGSSAYYLALKEKLGWFGKNGGGAHARRTGHQKLCSYRFYFSFLS